MYKQTERHIIVVTQASDGKSKNGIGDLTRPTWPFLPLPECGIISRLPIQAACNAAVPMLQLSCNRPAAMRSAIAILFITLSLCLPARAWEKGAASAIEAAAFASLPGEAGAFLKREKSSFASGWGENEETRARYAGFSTYDSSGYAAAKLGSQIALLRELFPHEKTPYMAYRMGVLARLVADLNSPFATAVSPEELELRSRFMKDVETGLTALKAPIQPPRLLYNPDAAVKSIVKRASGWAGPVRSQYVSGRGYNVIARQAAKTFYRSAVQMVRDVLFTVGVGRGGAVEAAERYNYYWDACHYYLRQGMAKEALAAYDKVVETAHALQLDHAASLQDAVEKYTLILNVSSLEEELRQVGAPPEKGVAEQLMATFLPGAERFAKQSLDNRREEDCRIALTLCLREGYHSKTILHICRSLYGLEGMKDLEKTRGAIGGEYGWLTIRLSTRLPSIPPSRRLCPISTVKATSE
ncbi:MAG: hypothetical protein P8123_04085 [bacterium]